jgi:hypothetical protein
MIHKRMHTIKETEFCRSITTTTTPTPPPLPPNKELTQTWKHGVSIRKEKNL